MMDSYWGTASSNKVEMEEDDDPFNFKDDWIE